MGDIIKHSSDNRVYVLVNKPHTGIQKDGQTLDITIQASYTGSKAPTATAELVNLSHDGMSPPTPAVGKVLGSIPCNNDYSILLKHIAQCFF